MPGKEDIELAGAAKVLKGLAAEVATAVRTRANAFMAKAADPNAIHQDLRTIAAIARTAIAVQAMQAAEDKADAWALEAHAKRAAAAVRAINLNPHEGDETDMNEPDPRLETPEGVAEIRQDARDGLERFFQRLETKRGDRTGAGRPDERGRGDSVEKLAVESPPVSTAA